MRWVTVRPVARICCNGEAKELPYQGGGIKEVEGTMSEPRAQDATTRVVRKRGPSGQGAYGRFRQPQPQIEYAGLE